ncbi:MAG: LysR substrate-binding domain-containing protein [Steroidobacteraceae bacterium]
MFHVQSLAPFVQIVKRGSFSAAAAHLGITPPAVSKSVARLERELGVRLFNRTTRQLHLTGEGREFYERITPLFDGMSAAIEEMRCARSAPSGLVRVSVGATFGRHCLMPRMRRFLQRYPEIDLEIEFTDNPTDLVGRGFDVELRHGHGRETSVVSRPLCAYPIHLVASPEYLSQCGVPRTVDDLSRHDCIGIRLPTGLPAHWRLIRDRRPQKPATRKRTEAFDIEPKGRLTVAAQNDMSLIAAVHGYGIAPSSLPAVQSFLEAGRLKIVLPEYRVQPLHPTDDRMFIHYPHREYLAPKVRVLVDYLIEEFRGGAPQAPATVRKDFIKRFAAA